MKPSASKTYTDIPSMLGHLNPSEPVYCVHPNIYRRVAEFFKSRFPGRVLYAVKANDDPNVLLSLMAGGIEHFDCASLTEIKLVRSLSDDVKCYFMVPLWLNDTASVAQKEFGVRHFVVDHLNSLEVLKTQIEPHNAVIFARMAVHHQSAAQDLSSKFGCPVEHMPELVNAIAQTGAEPALCFNVGSGVKSPDAYLQGLDMAHELLDKLSEDIRLIDIGGGFPFQYPEFEVPPLGDYLHQVANRISSLSLGNKRELMVEPGRSMAAEGVSAVSQVLLRKENRLYLNDGLYGIFWELRFDEHDLYPATVYRNGEKLQSEPREFWLYGPTCDSTDRLPKPFALPADIKEGDHIVVSHIGAYSMAGRTKFNGHFSDHVVLIEDQ
ncbi:MAG: type III PLP-dependent enzyme [Pseudomonadota bacterium]